MAPQTEAARVYSSPSHNDTEAASQQLLAEASSPVLRHSAARPAAVIGAHLLNAARVYPKPPALAPPVRAGSLESRRNLEKPGKLKRASLSSLVPQGSQRKGRGAKLYDIDPSPQKRSSLPAQVAAFEEQGNDVSGADETEDVIPETSQVQPEDTFPSEVPESGDIAGEDGAEEVRMVEEQPRQPDASSPTGRRRTRPSKGKSVESTSARPSDASAIEIQEQAESSIVVMKSKRKARDEHVPEAATIVEPSNKSPVAKKQRKLKGPKLVSPDNAEFEQGLISPRATTKQDLLPRGDPQPQVRIPIRSTRSRTAQAEAELAHAKDHSATAIPVAASGRLSAKPASTSTRSTSAAKPTSKLSQRPRAGNARVLEDEPAEPENGADNSDEAPEASEKGTRSRGEDDDVQEGLVRTEAEEEQQNELSEKQGVRTDDRLNEEGDGDQDEEVDAEASNTVATYPAQTQVDGFSPLQKVFRFIDSEPREGVCSTKWGRNIHRSCDRSRVTLSRSGAGPALEDVSQCKDELTTLIKSIDTKVREERRVYFKRDAFAYLFHSLTLVLEAMHDKLQAKGDITKSLESMQIVYHFIKDILRFKDTLDAWKVKIPQHTTSGRLIKDIESNLIAPLRVVEKVFRKYLGQLMKAEQTQRRFVALQQKRRDEEQQLVRQEAAMNAGRERRKRWQDLHIIRMQCEPDPSRRRRLRFVEPVQTVETDANGLQFERVPFFGERNMPPPQWTAASSGREWTKEQETVLLDALQSSAALDRIFTTHCGPGGALRDFSVSDFAAKLAWVRSGWAQLSHQNGWEIPQWVKDIPVLP